MASSTFTLIASYTTPVGGSSGTTFSSIPQTYTDLVIYVSGRTSNTGSQRNATDISITFNGSSSAYYMKILSANVAVDNPPISISLSNLSSNVWAGENPNADASSQIWGMSEIYIPNYTNSVGHKVMGGHNNTENNNTNAEVRFASGSWQSTAAITSLTLGGGSWIQYTTAYLYGIKNS
jgi:hypothetical protein